jgi:hypothetical protein
MEAPATISEALYGEESNVWIPSIASGIMNFLNRKCWKKVPHSIPVQMDRTIMKTTW